MHFTQRRFYKHTTLRTAAFTQSSFYAHVLLHREVCAERHFYTQAPLHTEAFTRGGGSLEHGHLARLCVGF